MDAVDFPPTMEEIRLAFERNTAIGRGRRPGLGDTIEITRHVPHDPLKPRPTLRRILVTLTPEVYSELVKVVA